MTKTTFGRRGQCAMPKLWFRFQFSKETSTYYWHFKNETSFPDFNYLLVCYSIWDPEGMDGYPPRMFFLAPIHVLLYPPAPHGKAFLNVPHWTLWILPPTIFDSPTVFWKPQPPSTTGFFSDKSPNIFQTLLNVLGEWPPCNILFFPPPCATILFGVYIPLRGEGRKELCTNLQR